MSEKLAASGELVVWENPHDGIDYTLTDRNESVLLPVNEDDLDDLEQIIEQLRE